MRPTPTENPTLPRRLSDFDTLVEALDYAARGETGANFYNGRGKLLATLHYAELREQAVLTARRYRQLGLKPGDKVALLAETTPDFFVVFFGCQYAGLIPLPLPVPTAFGRKDAYVDQIRNQLVSSGARALVRPDPMAELVGQAATGLDLLFVGSAADLAEVPAPDVMLHTPSKSDLCYIQYSSGSTRFPHGVMISNANLMINCHVMNKYGVRTQPDERAVSWLPFYHDMGLVGFMLGVMLAQVSIDYIATEEFARRPLTWLRLISENGGTISYSPSFGYELCARRLESPLEKDLNVDLSRWRHAGIGGEMIKPKVMNRFAEAFAPYGFSDTAFVASYGLAETVLAVSFAEKGKGMKVDTIDAAALAETHRAVPVDGSAPGTREFVTCGQVLPDHKVEIRDEDGTVLPDRAVGRVWVEGPSVMLGYYKDPEANAACLVDGWLDTGDMGYFFDGELVIVGRAKDMLIVNGRNVWPQDIEWSVERLPGIRSGDVAAIGVTDPAGEEQPVVLVQTRSFEADEQGRLAREVQETVQEGAGITCTVVLVPPRSLPKTTSGKLSRAKSRDQYVDGSLDVLHTRAPGAA